MKFRGFTLVELLIASTMMAIMFVGLSAHLRGGLMVWQQATTRAEAWQEHRIVLQRMERDLVNAVVYDDQAGSFGADKGQLPRPVFAEQALAFVTRATSGPATGRLVWITYACESPDHQQGLWRTQQPLGEARAQHAASAAEPLLNSCDGVSFAYAYNASSSQDQQPRLEWKSSWPLPESDPDWMKLPRLIMLALPMTGQRAEYVISVPQGLLKASPQG